jgi:hypothetical protein
MVLAVGCKSTSTRDGAPIKNSNAKWIGDYRKARAISESDPASACKTFQRLSEEKDFPPREVAKLRAWEVCTSEPSTAAINRKDLPEWLNEISLDVALKVAERNGDKPAELELASEKSKQKLPQSQKLAWINKALDRATRWPSCTSACM